MCVCATLSLTLCEMDCQSSSVVGPAQQHHVFVGLTNMSCHIRARQPAHCHCLYHRHSCHVRCHCRRHVVWSCCRLVVVVVCLLCWNCSRCRRRCLLFMCVALRQHVLSSHVFACVVASPWSSVSPSSSSLVNATHLCLDCTGLCVILPVNGFRLPSNSPVSLASTEISTLVSIATITFPT